MNNKTRELLIDLAHLVNQAIITDDDLIAHQALGDVADALASVLPLDCGSEKVEKEGGGVQRRDNNSSVHLDSPPPPSSYCTFQLARAGAYGIITMYDADGVRRLQAQIERQAEDYYEVLIFRAGENTESCVTIHVTGGFDRARRVAMGAMRGLLAAIGRKRRLRQHRKERKRIERELAATVARQLDDDDLAQRLENA